MISFIKEERKRLGFNQTYVAEKTGITVQSLINYEKGKRQPDLNVLIKMAEIGYDIRFVVTGQRDSNHLTNEEKFLLDKFRQTSKEKQTAVLGVLLFDGDSVADAVAGKSVTVGDNSVNVGGDVSAPINSPRDDTQINVKANHGQVGKKIINK